MPESAEEVYARVVALVGVDGRLPSPPVTEWNSFPWEGEVVTKVVQPPLASEEPRHGERGKPCWSCGAQAHEGVIWRNDRWLVRAPEKPSGLPVVVFLESRRHMDFDDLDDDMASEFGRLTARLHRVMVQLPNIGRVHVCKWGDGSAHLHTWFMARTSRLPQTRGSYAAEWDEILPPVPVEIWRQDLESIALHLAEFEGEVVADATR